MEGDCRRSAPGSQSHGLGAEDVGAGHRRGYKCSGGAISKRAALSRNSLRHKGKDTFSPSQLPFWAPKEIIYTRFSPGTFPRTTGVSCAFLSCLCKHYRTFFRWLLYSERHHFLLRQGLKSQQYYFREGHVSTNS